MIGDNPHGDIEGANRKGWESILVKSGIYQERDLSGELMDTKGAKYIVEDLEEAFKLICRLEKLSF